MTKDDKVRQGKPRACEYLRMMLLARQPEALQDLTEALGVYDNRELLDKEHMYKRFNPQVLSDHILIPASARSTYMPKLLCKPRVSTVLGHPLLLLRVTTTRRGIPGIQSYMNFSQMSPDIPFQLKIVL
jgi:hypothetical protein